jgi:hypothetical protein
MAAEMVLNPLKQAVGSPIPECRRDDQGSDAAG